MRRLRHAAPRPDPWRALGREVLRDSPLAWWPIDESKDVSLLDDRMGSIDATKSGPQLGVGSPLLGGCAEWLTQTDRAEFTAQSGSFGAGQAWSGGAWVKTTSADAAAGYAGNPALTVLGDHSGNVWQGFGVHGGKVRYSMFNNTSGLWQYADGATPVNDDRWHQIGFSCTGAVGANNTLVYADGRIDATATFTIAVHPSVAVGFDTIGAGYAGGAYGDGFLGWLSQVWMKKAVVAPERFRAQYDAVVRSGRLAA